MCRSVRLQRPFVEGVTLADRTSLLIVVTAFALLAIPTVARAHAGNNDPNVLHVCIGKVTKVVRSVGVDGACISAPPAHPIAAETPDHWARQGPAGPKGDKGDKGDQGLQGIQGLQGNPGTNGTNGIDGTSVTFVDYFSGNQNGCPNGGAIYAAGNPPVNTYVCNGTNGIDGEDGQDGTGATNPDPPCFDNTNRYVDCGNGTVTDTVTGLIWLKQWNCLSANSWAAANQAAAGLTNGDCNLTDNSSAGDWRLPTKGEWTATIARAVLLHCIRNPQTIVDRSPSLTNDTGTACYGTGSGSSFAGVEALSYWSSTTDETSPNSAWDVPLSDGSVSAHPKSFILRVWPVRGGPR